MRFRVTTLRVVEVTEIEIDATAAPAGPWETVGEPASSSRLRQAPPSATEKSLADWIARPLPRAKRSA